MAYFYHYVFLALQLTTLGISVTLASKKALFVFGDSYGDTGNHQNDSDTTPAEYKPWRQPYGITWPGFPTGRYSNGRLFTDFYARYLGVYSPIPYAKVHTGIMNNGNVGINFAFGGSGVFPTASFCPNVSTQIDQLQGVINNGLVSQKLINASVALILVNGNDYAKYIATNGTTEGFPAFIQAVVQQLTADIDFLFNLGFKSFAVSNLGPISCLPAITKQNNYSSCDAISNLLALYHNFLLASSIATLKNTLPNIELITLDFNDAFNVVLQGFLSNGTQQPYSSCCQGINDATCGEVDEQGVPLYTVCSSPSESFYWDEAHPTDAAWKAISNVIFLGLEDY